MLANRGIYHLKTGMVDIKVDGITKKSMFFFVIDGDANHILLGRDHPSVKTWISSKPTAETVDVPILLAAITRSQSQVFEDEEVEGMVLKQNNCSSRSKNQKGSRLRSLPIVHEHEIQFTNLEVELTKLADKDSSSTIPPAEEGVRGHNTRAVTEEACMREEKGCMREEKGCVREDEGCMREDEGHIRGDEIEEDISGLGEADFLNGLEIGVHSDLPLPILSKGKRGLTSSLLNRRQIVLWLR